MTTREPAAWHRISLEVVLAIHGRQVVEHGGADGIRDLGRLESTLARPSDSASYSDSDVAVLAAGHTHGLVSNRGFVDGNKRVAWVTARLILLANDLILAFDPFDAIRMMESVAAGQTSEEELANWFRVRLTA